MKISRHSWWMQYREKCLGRGRKRERSKLKCWPNNGSRITTLRALNVVWKNPKWRHRGTQLSIAKCLDRILSADLVQRAFSFLDMDQFRAWSMSYKFVSSRGAKVVQVQPKRPLIWSTGWVQAPLEWSPAWLEDALPSQGIVVTIKPEESTDLDSDPAQGVKKRMCPTWGAVFKTILRS